MVENDRLHVGVEPLHAILRFLRMARCEACQCPVERRRTSRVERRGVAVVHECLLLAPCRHQRIRQADFVRKVRCLIQRPLEFGDRPGGAAKNAQRRRTSAAGASA